MPDDRWKLSAETITAASAVVAALVALWVGIWENAQQRAHNRLSVSPALELVAEVRSSDADTVDRAVIRLVNEGVGPAIVEDVRIRVREPGGEEHAYGGWTEAEPALERWGVDVTSRTELGGGTVLGVGREHDLVTFEAEGVGESGQRSFTRLLEQVGVEIVYRSVYEDEYRATFGEDE